MIVPLGAYWLCRRASNGRFWFRFPDAIKDVILQILYARKIRRSESHLDGL